MEIGYDSFEDVIGEVREKGRHGKGEGDYDVGSTLGLQERFVSWTATAMSRIAWTSVTVVQYEAGESVMWSAKRGSAGKKVRHQIQMFVSDALDMLYHLRTSLCVSHT